MLNDYYALRDWDENGIPRERKIRELGLEREWEMLHNA
jgi:aldehyde:ferredoxin oxidoreductase